MKNEEQFKKVFNEIYKFIHSTGWGGACHTTVAMLYAFCKKLNIEATPCIGEVSLKNFPFDHSWLEIEGCKYDIAISLPLQEFMAIGPIYCDIDLKTHKRATIKYGIYYEGLGEEAFLPYHLDIYTYLYNCPSPNLIKLINDIGSKCGIYITNKWLKENLSKEYFVLVS